MRLLLIALVGLLAGCASVGEGVLKAGTTGTVRFSPEDVDAAILIADNAKDAIAGACFKAIRKHLDVPASPVTRGIVSAYAAARVAARAARAPLAEDVHVACSPLVVDAGTFAGRLGLVFGAAP